jgi:hypothetical protein
VQARSQLSGIIGRLSYQLSTYILRCPTQICFLSRVARPVRDADRIQNCDAVAIYTGACPVVSDIRPIPSRRLVRRIFSMCYLSVLCSFAFLATSSLASDHHGKTPMQLRLAYAGNGGMHVSWNTFSRLEQPRLLFGTSPDCLDQQASSNISVTYHTSTTYNNHVKLTGLEPNTKYYYQPEFSNSNAPYSFVTSRVPGDHTAFTVALVVDMGTMGALGLSTSVGDGGANPLEPGQNNTIQSLESTLPSFDFLWHRKSTTPPVIIY